MHIDIIAGVEHQRIDGSRIAAESEGHFRDFLKAHPPALQDTYVPRFLGSNALVVTMRADTCS